MCGFVAVFSPQVCFSEQKVINALESIRHRGPDYSAIWSSKDQKVWLGHTRLSIVDIEGGAQPLSTPDGFIHCVVNGEFYDYVSIRDNLKEQGYYFKTESDSEILLYLYQHYGVHCLEYLRGEFSFVLWDEKRQQIFAARDRFGIKPLFYYQQGRTVYFASEVKALKMLGVPMYWDKRAYWQEVSCLHLPSGCLFKDIYEVPSGHFAIKEIEGNKLNVKLYWDMHYPTESELKHRQFSDREVIANFKDLFNEAVSLRLKADVPVACYLSGGIDSCSVLGVAQNMCEHPIETFTLCFDNPEYDEAVIAKAMTKHAGSHYQPINISGDMLAEHYEDTIYKGEKCAFNGNAIAKYILRREVEKRGIKVVLTGEGADDILAGYAGFRKDFIFQYLNDLPLAERDCINAALNSENHISNGLLSTDIIPKDLNFIKAVLGFVPNWMACCTQRGRMAKCLFTRDYFDFVDGIKPADVLLNSLSLSSMKDIGPLHKSLYSWSKSMLPHYLLTMLGDRVEMAHSVEGRLPFLDHKLVEYVVSLPEQYKIRNMTEKYILREAMKPILTDEVYHRQKHPFYAPQIKDTCNQTLNEFMMDLLHSQAGRNMPFIDHKKMFSFFHTAHQLPAAERNVADIVMHIVTSSIIIQDRFGMQS